MTEPKNVKKIIQEMVLYKGRSSLKGTQLYSIGSSKFRIEINSDGYTDQSYVSLSKWTEKSGYEVITSQPVEIYYRMYSEVHIGHNSETSSFALQFKKEAISNMLKISKNFL